MRKCSFGTYSSKDDAIRQAISIASHQSVPPGTSSCTNRDPCSCLGGSYSELFLVSHEVGTIFHSLPILHNWTRRSSWGAFIDATWEIRLPTMPWALLLVMRLAQNRYKVVCFWTILWPCTAMRDRRKWWHRCPSTNGGPLTLCDGLRVPGGKETSVCP